MGKYSSYSRPQPKPKPEGVHPVMRGIGCILIVLVPIFAFVASGPIINFAVERGLPIPPQWYGPPTIPPLLEKVQGLTLILQYLKAQNNLEVHLVFTIIITIVLGGIMSIFYGYMYSAFGPPRYGPQDAPPIRKKVKAYKR